MSDFYLLKIKKNIKRIKRFIRFFIKTFYKRLLQADSIYISKRVWQATVCKC